MIVQESNQVNNRVSFIQLDKRILVAKSRRRKSCAGEVGFDLRVFDGDWVFSGEVLTITCTKCTLTWRINTRKLGECDINRARCGSQHFPEREITQT